MTVHVKICGLKDEASLQAAVKSGASYVGFVFYPPSPRAVTIEQAAKLAALAPSSVAKVGLFVDASDDEIRQVFAAVKLDIIQLHGNETIDRVAYVKNTFQTKVMKAVRVGVANDLSVISAYEAVADYLLLDSKSELVAGGSGKSFDWTFLKNQKISKPWMLAGGLNAGNLKAAVLVTGAVIVDVSSGVEDSPGHKNSAKIRDLLALARTL